MFSRLAADIAYSLRGFALRPTYASVVVLTLACGIAVNVTIFSIFEQMLLKPLPVPDPGSLVNLASPGLRRGSTSCNDSGSCDEIFSYPMFRDLEKVDGPFAGVAAHRYVDANLALDGRTFYGRLSLVSGSYFPLLGLQPALGRLLGADDDAAEGEARAVVLGYEFWQNVLGADASVLGRALVVNGEPLTVVGVAPRGFHGTTIGARPQVYVPITFRWSTAPGSIPEFENRRAYWVYLFARTKPGVTLAVAAAAINGPYRAILSDVEAPLQEGSSEQNLAAFKARQIELTSGARGQSSVPDRARAPLEILLVATGLVLLIACVNIANLMLARGATRVTEIAVRASMGAGALRIGALLLAEVALLAAFAALVSLPLTLAAGHGIASLLPAYASEDIDFSLNKAALAATSALALASALVFGLAPAWRLMRTDPGPILQSQGARSTGSKAAGRFRVAMTTTQIALSMTLLVLAGWFAQSLANIARIDLGFRSDALATFTLAPGRNGYTPERSAEFFARLEEDLGGAPGVTASASALISLVDNSSWGSSIRIEGIDFGPDPRNDARLNYVSAGFFRTVGMPLVAGTGLAAARQAEKPTMAVVNERFAEQFGLGDYVIGRHIALGGRDTDLGIEIVGLVRDAKYSSVKEEIPPLVFLPRVQSPFIGELSFYVRSDLAAGPLRAEVEKIVARRDADLPIKDFRTVEQVVHDNVFLDHFMGTLAAALAVIATALASLGLYGVLSYNVAQRTREIGLRLALGASPRRLRGLVLRQVGLMAAFGGAIGLVAALALGRLAQALLYGLEPSDLRVLVLAVATLLAAVIMAGYLPARRASLVDPMVALRCD
jgi:putative ABC transport system permease protein